MRVYIDLNPDEHAELKRRAAVDDRPVSVWLRRAVQAMLTQPSNEDLVLPAQPRISPDSPWAKLQPVPKPRPLVERIDEKAKEEDDQS